MNWPRAMTLLTLLLALNPLSCKGEDRNGQQNGESTRRTNRDNGGGGLVNFESEDIADIVGRVTLGADKGLLFYAYDTLAYPQKPIELVAKLESVRMSAVPGVTLGFFEKDKLIGQAVTNQEGLAEIQWTPPQQGIYQFEVRVLGATDEVRAKYPQVLQLSPTPMVVSAQPKDAQFAVIDLDHTVVASSFWRVLTLGAEPMPGSVDVTKQVAQKYNIIYLTHRPNLLTIKSKNWLKENGYPAAPLLVAELRDVMDSGAFKTAKLRELKKAYPNVAIGIGDKLSDAQAYVDNGMVAYLIPHYDQEDPEKIMEMANQLRQLDGKRRLHVVTGWSEIQESLLGQQGPQPQERLTPQAFAQRLEDQARRLRALKVDD